VKNPPEYEEDMRCKKDFHRTLHSNGLSRRDFLKLAVMGTAGLLAGCRSAQQPGGVPSVEPVSMLTSTGEPTDVPTPISEPTGQLDVVEEDEQASDGWTISSPSAEGIDTQKIADMLERVREGAYGSVHSILIVKRGKLVVEEYFEGYPFAPEENDWKGHFVAFGPDTIDSVASVTKSITSSLVGIAIDEGFIRDVSEKLFAFFPEYSHLNDDKKNEITIEHLLTMNSGLEWRQSGPGSDTDQLFGVDDPLGYILNKPVVGTPGTRFDYTQANPILLGEVIKKVTGLRVDDFAKEYLFAPLGITQYEWRILPNNVIYTAGDLRMRPRDMAKFGYLFLREGKWKGKRIVSEEWVRESTQGRVMGDYGLRYGYLWWVIRFREAASYAAMGWGGQGIFVFPTLDMVTVFKGGNYVGENDGSEPYFPPLLLESYILPSVLS
jgi:CubicO group peptidase (beta-lactamase class C family)